MNTYGMEELAVGPCPYLVNYSGLQVQENSSGNVLSRVCLREERAERIIASTDTLQDNLESANR